MNLVLPIIPKEANENEKRLLEKYTRIQETLCGDSPNAHNVWLVVGGRSFLIGGLSPADSAEEASWSCWMLAKAIDVIIKVEK